MNCFGRSSKIKEDNDKIDASVSRTALSTVQHFRRRIFCGKTFGFRAQTIASVACQQKRRENAAASDFVDKSLVKSVGHV